MKICENCEKEHDGTYGSGRFCSCKCSRGFSTKNKRKEINAKVSKTLKGKKPKLISICKNCNKEYVQTRKTQQFCCKGCAASYRNINNVNISDIARKGGLKSVQSQNRRSKNEIYFAELCKDYFNNIKTNEPIFNGWDADVIIEDYKIAVLWNGKWHYEQCNKKHSVKQVQNRDKIKLKEIANYGYTSYIIKDMGKYNKQFVEEQFEIFIKYIADGR